VNRKPLFLTLLISAAFVLLLAACTSKTTTTPVPETEEASSTDTAEPACLPGDTGYCNGSGH